MVWIIRLCLFILGILTINFTSGQKVQRLYIAPETSQGAPISTVFHSVKYIPLETTKESEFGYISVLRTSEKYFFIYDINRDGIFIFNRDGSFHIKITNKTLAGSFKKGIRANLGNFTIDTYKKHIIIPLYDLDTKQEKYAAFDFEGVLSSLRQYDQKVFDKIIPLSDSVSVGISSQQSQESIKDSSQAPLKDNIYFIKENKVYDSAVPINFEEANNLIKDHLGFNIGQCISTNDSLCYYGENYRYTIYELNANGIFSIYKFIFPLCVSLPVDFLQSAWNLKRNDFLRKEKPKTITSIQKFYKISDNIFFRTNDNERVKSGNSSNNEYLIYNLTSGRLLSPFKIVSDSSNYFLPWVSTLGGFNFADDRSLFTSVSSLAMFQAYEATKDKHANYPPVLENYFATESRKSNPVIVQLKPKEKF